AITWHDACSYMVAHAPHPCMTGLRVAEACRPVFRVFNGAARPMFSCVCEGFVSVTLQALRIADSIADLLGYGRRPLTVAELSALARRRSGHADFGDVSFEGPLRRFLDACAQEARLSLVGRIATRWDVVRFLTNLLRFRAEEARRPNIATQGIDRPIF